MAEHLYKELRSSLADSNGDDRKKWATQIIRDEIRIRELIAVLAEDIKTTNRFLWLVSDVAMQDANYLFRQLPELFEAFRHDYPQHLFAFASWWHYCGVPEENEAEAMDLLFKCFLSAETTVTIKTRALWVLVKLSRKYPDMKQELMICIADQSDKYSAEFRKRTEKILADLKQ